MSTSTESVARSYLMHGVRLEVLTDDPAIAAAMDLRLLGFPEQADRTGTTVRLEFTTTKLAAPTTSDGQSVYETPYGSLRYFADQDVLAGELGGVALQCELSRLHARIAAPVFRGRVLYFATHPVVTVALMELMERLDRFSLHAACLADHDGQGVLISGPSGAGKSTLTLALARAGMQFLGDDVLFLQRPVDAAGRVRALGFADTLGIGSFASSRFPELARLTAEPPSDGFPKRLHRFEDLFGRKPMLSCDPRVIVFPEVAAELPSNLEPLDRGDALLRLVPDVLMTNHETTQAHVAAIAQLLTQVSCYTLRSGYDLEKAADSVRRLL